MKLKFIFSAAFFMFFSFIFSQEIVFSETMGPVSGTTSIAAHESANGFDNQELTMTSGGAANPGDVRNTQLPSPSPANNANIWLTNSPGDRGFAIENIDASGFTSLQLQFNYFKTGSGAHATLSVEYWNGSSYVAFANTDAQLFNEAATAASDWYTSKLIPVPAAAQVNNLKIRFLKTGNVGIRIDNVLMQGNAPVVDWANVESPSSASIDVGTNTVIKSRVLEAGVTNIAGASASIIAEIGYSSTNNNPKFAGWNWVTATFDSQQGMQDEYSATIGASLPIGTHYFASRFKLSGGPWRYGGYNGGFWNGTTNLNGVITVNDITVDYANVQTPETGTCVTGTTFNVYAQVYKLGLTDTPANQGAGIQAWIGYNATNNNPSTTGWTWVPATFNASGGGTNNDEYVANIGAVIPGTGTKYYASRFQLGAGTYKYGGITNDGLSGGIWDGTTYKSGVLVVTSLPVSEIDIRGGAALNQPIVSGATTTSTLNSTEFASTVIGNFQIKNYRIKNLGSATLNVSTFTKIGTNPADFTVSLGTPQSIAPGAFSDFTIKFAPLAQGDRTATIQIANNDSNENPYNILLRGNGDCAATSNSITPLSGPVGTEITVTAIFNNLVGSSVTINGVSAIVTPVDATHIKVKVPAGAQSGPLVTTNSQGCSASTPFTVIDNVISSCEGSGSTRNKIFISEVTDHGSGAHSYVELYNATGAIVNLLNYKVNIHNNGASSPTSTITLPSFNLANNTAYVVAFGGTDATTQYAAVVANITSGVGGVNGNDNIRLLDNTGTWIDQWGDTNNVPFTIAPKDYYYRRVNTGITAPSTTWNPADWDAATPVDYNDIGLYDFSAGSPPIINTQPQYTPSCRSNSFTVVAEQGVPAGNLLAYQWYSVAPNATTWTQLSNAGVFSGVTTDVLMISSMSGLQGYQFYCQVREDSNTCYTATNAVQVQLPQLITWNGSWLPTAPNSSSPVVISSNYDTATNGSFEACTLVVNSGKTLSIASGDYVSVERNLTVTGTLTIADSGSLIMISDAGTVTNTGTTNVLRTTKPYKKYDYTYWSSPVQSSNIGTTFPTWRTDRSYSFDTAAFADVSPLDGFDDNGDDWVFEGPTATMTNGKGYIVMAPTTGSFPTTKTVTFSGAVNNGLITIPLALSGDNLNTNDDFNLIGNPYPSAISATDFILANNGISGTLYFWSHVTAVNTTNPGPNYSNYDRDDYALFNLTGGTRASLTTPASSIPTGFIASGQGFFVEAETATPIVFNNSMRSKLHQNNDFFRSQNVSQVAQRDRIWLNLENEDDLFSQQLIGYFAEATLGYDRGYDGIASKTGNTVSFYSVVENENYRIQARSSFSSDDLVPLGFSTTVAGDYSIAIDNAEGQLADIQNVYLDDLLIGTIHDLKESPYLFNSNAGTFDSRFVLRYTNSFLHVPVFNAEQINVSCDNHTIHVKSSAENIASVSVIDLLGRKIFESEKLLASQYSISNLPATTEVLIVKIVLLSGEQISKKVILK